MIRIKALSAIAAVVSLLATWLVFAASPTAQLPPINNPPTDERLPGKFIWFDLATPAITNQRAFYRSVFGWTFEAPIQTEDGYVLIKNGSRSIAGMFSYEPAGGEQDGAAWIALMSGADPDGAARTVKANGGSVEIEPTNVAGRGRHAVFRDPGGAVFGVLRSDSGDPSDEPVELGDIIWVDLFARDIEAMTTFYGALAPFDIEDRNVTEDVARKVLSAHGMPRAGIVPVDEEANRSSWVPYVRVDDIDATLQKVVDGGGFSIVSPEEGIHDGNVAIFVDPNGGVTGIVKYDYAEESSQ
jgi:predicted enzyme related to lactoylglutathione lyase